MPWGLNQGEGLIVKIILHMGAYSRGGLIRGGGAKSRTYGILKKKKPLSHFLRNVKFKTAIIFGDMFGLT